jgi:hypothetical protein
LHVGAPPFLSVKVANFLGLFLTEEADSLAQDAFLSTQTILCKVTSVIEFAGVIQQLIDIGS